MRMLGYEAATSYNQRLGPSGFSPATRLFGTRARVYGELYKNGEFTGWHPDALDAGTEVATRLEIRRAAQEAAARYEHEQLVRTATAARSRVEVNFEVGRRIYFYRKASFQRKPAAAAFAGVFLGPGTIIGMHGSSSVWVQFGGRVYLVAKEHVRAMSPDEEVVDTHRPLREALENLKRAIDNGTEEYEDLTQRSPPSDQLLLLLPRRRRKQKKPHHTLSLATFLRLGSWNTRRSGQDSTGHATA